MMAKNNSLNPGVGTKCLVLTQFICPKIMGVACDHWTTGIVKEMHEIVINQKTQVCFLYECINGPTSSTTSCYMIKRYVKIIEEGSLDGFFF